MDCQDIVSDIVLGTEFSQGLYNIEAFSHITVLYWMNIATQGEKAVLKVHPMGNHKLPLMGVFATRSPHRPNLIGISTVELIRHVENVLTVRGLDALDRTPVLDIKPYIAEKICPCNMKIPDWLSD